MQRKPYHKLTNSQFNNRYAGEDVRELCASKLPSGEGPDTMKSSSCTLKVRVAAKNIEAEDICVYELVAADGLELPPFSAGAHIDVRMTDTLVRQYSLCNASSQAHSYRIAVQRNAGGRGGSIFMHDGVHIGDTFLISQPKNHFPLEPGPGKSILFAGGIGITPILCMADRLSSIGADFEMHYCARTSDRAAFLDHIASSQYASAVHLHFDNESAEQKLDIAAALDSYSSDDHVYVCGPTGFMNAVLEEARKIGWPASQLHYESFGTDTPPKVDGIEFEVQLASSGRIVPIPKDKSVAKSLEEIGICIPTSCEQGVCGTCLTRVVSGIPEHLDSYLTSDERSANDVFLPCCSRSKTPLLVLDL